MGNTIKKGIADFEGFVKEKEKLQEYLNRYSRTQLSSDASISFLDYDWQLNQQ